MTTESFPDPTDQKETEPATSRRSMLRTAAIIGGATIAGGTLVSRQASAANGDAVLVGGNFEGTSPTEIYYHGGTPYPAGPSVVSGGEDNSPLQPLFPAGVGGYGVDKVVNGVHGSTAVNTGFGVVAANGAAPANGSAAPKALALASLGSQVQFLTPAQVAAAAGLVDYPATVGPSAGTHSPGELYVDDEYNLWFAVPDGASVRWIRLAGQQTGGSLVTLPTPVRILDTRANNGSKVPNGATVTVGLKTAANGASSGLPVGATTAVLNLTVDGTEGRGFHAAYSADATFDPASPFSSVNWDAAGQTRANLAVVRLGSASPATERAVKFTAGGGGSTHLIVDLVGYYV